MSTKRCYYETLEVERNADDSKLKAAFRKLAMKWHPDKNPGDASSEIRFKEINEAYEVLKDGDKRAAYDRFGHAAFEQGMEAAAVPASAPALPRHFRIFSRICSAWPGSAARRRRPRARRRPALQHGNHAGGSLRRQDRQIEIPVSVTCESCSGTGAKAGTKPKTCSTCGGAGRVRQAQGFFTLERTCPGCQGRGQMIEDPCPSCTGSGRVTRERTLSVNIPQGVEDGTRIRLAGEGEAGVRGGPSGDLYIFLSLARHRVLPARWRRSALPGPDLDGDGFAGRRIRGADHRQGQDQGENPRRNAVRPALSHCIKRHAGAALAPDRRHVCPGRGRNAAESRPRSSRNCWPSSKNYRPVQPNPRRRVSSPRSRTSSATASAPARSRPIAQWLDRNSPADLYLFMTIF